MTHSLNGLHKWVRHPEWQDLFKDLMTLHIGSVCAGFDISPEQLADLLGEHHSNVLMGCVFEDLLATEREDGSNIVDHYLKRRGWKESASNRAYMMGLRCSVMSLYEVSSIVRDESFLARDLLRGGEPVKVSERSGTHYLKPWDRIGARLVQTGKKTEMAGGALPISLEVSEALLAAFRRPGKYQRRKSANARKNKPSRSAPPALDDELLRPSAAVFTNFWLGDLVECCLHPKFPQLQNTDGEDIAFTTVSYPLAPDASTDALKSALDSIPSLRREDDSFWNWSGYSKDAKSPPTSDSQVFITKLDDGSICLGTIELQDRTLVLETNSPQRAVTGRALIEPVLDRFVGQPHVASRTIAEMMASRPERHPNAAEKQNADSSLTPMDQRALTHGFLDEHYLGLLDQPVPVLGNVSPRKASKTAKGREKVVAWLKMMENAAATNEAGDPMADYDFGWLWKALNVSELRR